MALDAAAIQQLATAIAGVNATALSAPAFWTTNPSAWFVRLEASFETHSPPITVDKTKFNHVIKLVGSSTSLRVLSVIESPPETGKYNALKTALLAAFETTQFQKDTALLKMTGLGDRRPSELLQYMRSQNKDPETLFRALFLNQLPLECQRIVNRTQEPDLAKVAAMADRVLEVDRPAVAVSAVGATAGCESDSDSDGASAGAAAINWVSGGGNAKKPGKQGFGKPSQQQQQQHKAPTQQSNFALCKFHSKFGQEAINCAGKVNGKPCAMAPKPGNGKASTK